MSISEQVKELREYADYINTYGTTYPKSIRLLNEAADTIESLSKLQAENMERSDDLISRRALINTLFVRNGKMCPDNDIDNFPVTINVKDVKKAIRNAPTAISNKSIGQSLENCGGGWIPCSERMPEENEEVICCFKSGIVKALVLFNCKFHGKVYAYEKSDIIAWMPLPEPYHEP